jgi:hypothetical protein
MLQRRIIPILVCMLALGCTSLADENTKGPPLARIGGTLTLADGAEVPDEQIRMTLLWGTEESGNISNQLGEGGPCSPSPKFSELKAQSADLDPSFPSSFTLDITEPPPAETLLAVEEGGEKIQAGATIVVYADGDNDGVLDVRTEGAPSPDRVLATSLPERWRTYEGADIVQYEVYYSTEPYTYDDRGLVLDWPQGFSMQAYSLQQGGTAIVPIDTPIELRVTGAPYLQDLLCESVCNESPNFECPANPNDLAEPHDDAIEFLAGNTGQPGYGWATGGDDGYVTMHKICSPSGYSWTRMACEGCSCVTEGCFYAKEDVAEEDWPCVD